MATQYPEARVLIIMTGGTICMKHSPEGLIPARGFLEEGMKPRPSFNDGSVLDDLPVRTDPSTTIYLPSLRTPLSTYSRHVRYTLYEFPVLLDSSSISSAGWSQIALTIQNNYSLFDGFVILHGTDSLAYTSSALSFMLLHLGKPVILTGSQASIFALQSDAVDNLLGSLIIAGTFMIPEVCLFFHHSLFRGNRCTKVSATSFSAFASPNHPPLALVTATGVEVNWPLIRRPKTLQKFDIQTNLDTAHVACLRIFPGIKPEMIDSVLRVPGLRGLILETFGAGNAPSGEDGSFTRVIEEGVKRGIVIINVSQCQSGFVSPLYAPATALGAAGVVFGHDLTTEAALTKLSYLLAIPPSRPSSPFPPDHPLYKPSPSLPSHPQMLSPFTSSLSSTVGTPETQTPTSQLARTDLAYIHKQMQLSLRGEMTSLHTTSFSHPISTLPTLSEKQSAFAALGYAIAQGNLPAVLSLLNSGTSTEDTESSAGGIISGTELITLSDGMGNSVLHLAAVGPSKEILKELLLRGASVHARNLVGNTPLWLARKIKNKEAVGLLESTGALLHVEEREVLGGGGGRKRMGSVDRGV